MQHFDEPQVHAHVCVKAEGMDGHRLNPRKADLQRWRERFAHELRERGLEAEATRRKTRLHQERIDKPWQVTRLEQQGHPTNPQPQQSDAERVKAWKETNDRNTVLYEMIIAALRSSAEAVDRLLAAELQRATEEKSKLKRKQAERPGVSKPTEIER